MTKRIKLFRPALRTRTEAEATVREITERTITRNQLALQMDAKITEIKEHYEARFAELDQELRERTDLVRSWAEDNQSEFAGLKSLAMTHGVVGWRTGQPTLKTLSGWTWDRVLEKIRTIPQIVAAGYVRVKEEVNKHGLLADRELLGPDALRAVGCRVAQEESFFVEPILTETTDRQTATPE